MCQIATRPHAPLRTASIILIIQLIKKLTQLEGMTSITLSPNTRRDNVIMGNSYEVLWGQGFITDYIGNVKYQISPGSFYQVNPVQTEKLY